MKRIIVSFNCFLQDNQQMHNVRHVDIHSDKTIYCRSNDADGETRYYNFTIAEFEREFRINLANYLTNKDVAKFTN